MMRFFGILSAGLKHFWIIIRTYGHSGVTSGEGIERSNQSSEALENMEDARRIQNQIDKDRADHISVGFRKRVYNISTVC